MYELEHYRDKSIRFRDLLRILEEKIVVKSLQTADKTLRQTRIVSHTRRMHEKIREGGIRETSFDLKV